MWSAQVCTWRAVSGWEVRSLYEAGVGGEWWMCLRGFEQPVGGKRHVSSGVEEAGWGAGLWSVYRALGGGHRRSWGHGRQAGGSCWQAGARAGSAVWLVLF